MTGIGGATYVALSGGIGGAKLSLGLSHLLGDRLTIVANTGDDFEHLGLTVSPDVDTTLYTLAGLVNPETGWGRRDETWNFMQSITALGGPSWFNLGDKDLATHVERTRRLQSGEPLSAITLHLARAFGISARVLPMANEPVRTIIESDAGTLAFQEYFVRDRCRPVVRCIRYDGADKARLTPEIAAALSRPTLAGIVICPSNPWLSIDPILAVPGLREALRASGAPVIAVTPIVGGRALKGPTAKIMAELGLSPGVRTIAEHYAGVVDCLIVDKADEIVVATLPLAAMSANTVMNTLADKIDLAKTCLAFCARLASTRDARRQAGAR
jgi:LPPG:FO 2-phospho-L-lactate transferase